jgi:uncharacterized protein with FMN-binding domain
MKAFFQTNRLILMVTLLLVGLFAAGGAYSNYMTNRITFHQFSDLFPNAISFHAYTPTTIADEESFVAAYHAMDKKDMVGVVYVVAAQGKVGNLLIAYGVDVAMDKVTGIKVVSQNETPEYYSRLSNSFFGQFANYSFDKLNMTISTVAGATLSSNAFQLGLVAARAQYALDFDFEIPSAVVLINQLVYNLDLATIAQKPILANITDLTTGETIDVSLSATFDFIAVETAGKAAPSAAVQAELKTTAQRDFGAFARTVATGYDALTRTLTVKTRGYAAVGIVATIVFNETLDGVVSGSFVSVETYDQGHEYDMAHGSAPGIENYLYGRYAANQTVSAVAGATSTSNGMIALFGYLNQILTGNGGN